MPPTSLIAAAFILPPVLVLHQHFRLLALYPTQPISPELEISRRKDRPAVGMGSDPTKWVEPSAGEQWTVTVPRKWLTTRKDKSVLVSSEDEEMVNAFAAAFWRTFPLRLEERLMRVLIPTGTGPFQYRAGSGIVSDEVTERKKGQFYPGTKVLGGLFVVDAHDKTPATLPGETTAIEGPIVTSWWLKDAPKTPSSSFRGLKGGYHSFAVEPLPPSSESSSSPNDLVRLTFASHLTLITKPISDSSPITSPLALELEGYSTLQKLTMHFHQFYSRILLHLAVRELRKGAEQS